MLIVTGAHLRAELNDRPVAYGLRERILTLAQEKNLDPAPQVIVCSDVWYLNNEDLLDRPTICIGSPGVNALTASLIDRLPTAYSVRDTLSVQLDLEWLDLIVLCWGIDHGATHDAVAAFVSRYLDAFLGQVDRANQRD